MTILVVILCGLVSIVYGVWAIRSVMASDAGSARMQEIAGAVAEGAQAYLKRQYTTIGIVGVVILIALGILLGKEVAIGFLIGAVLSGLAGFIGMNVSVRANVRTAQASTVSLAAGLDIAFKAGAVTGMLVAGLALLGVAVYYGILTGPLGHAQQTQADHQQAGDRAAAEGDVQRRVQSQRGGLRGTHVGAHRHVHADEAGGTRQDRAEHEADRGPDAQLRHHGNHDRQHDADDGDGPILTAQVRLRALLNRCGDFLHPRIARGLLQNPGSRQCTEHHGREAAEKGESQTRHIFFSSIERKSYLVSASNTRLLISSTVPTPDTLQQRGAALSPESAHFE